MRVYRIKKIKGDNKGKYWDGRRWTKVGQIFLTKEGADRAIAFPTMPGAKVVRASLKDY